MRITILPAILESDVAEIQIKADKIKDIVKTVSVDIIDGLFADNLTVGVSELNQVDFGELKIELQLMTQDPDDLLGECHTLGTKRVYGHIEQLHSQENFVNLAQEFAIEPGLALDLFTPVESLESKLLDRLSGVLLMAVKAGFSGQTFNPLVLEKIKDLRSLGFQGDIQIDGGMNKDTISQCVAIGANHFSVTSFLWGQQDLGLTLAQLTALG